MLLMMINDGEVEFSKLHFICCLLRRRRRARERKRDAWGTGRRLRDPYPFNIHTHAHNATRHFTVIIWMLEEKRMFTCGSGFTVPGNIQFIIMWKLICHMENEIVQHPDSKMTRGKKRDDCSAYCYVSVCVHDATRHANIWAPWTSWGLGAARATIGTVKEDAIVSKENVVQDNKNLANLLWDQRN